MMFLFCKRRVLLKAKASLPDHLNEKVAARDP
jgi:hypothetical protein